MYFLMQTFQGGEAATSKLQNMIFGGIVNNMLVKMKLRSESKNLFEL